MTIELLREILLWCSIINMGLLIFSSLMFSIARKLVYGLHGKWYKLTEEQFNSIFYTVMLFYKTLIIFLNIVPYIVLRIVT